MTITTPSGKVARPHATTNVESIGVGKLYDILYLAGIWDVNLHGGETEEEVHQMVAKIKRDRLLEERSNETNRFADSLQTPTTICGQKVYTFPQGLTPEQEKKHMDTELAHMDRRFDEAVEFEHQLKHQPKKLTSLQRVLRYENESIVAKIMKDCELGQEEATTLFKDTLKFLWLAGTFRGCVPSPQVDKGWHIFVLFTMEYRKFCLKYFRRFIHHRPHHVNDKPDGNALKRTMELVTQNLHIPLTGNWQYITAEDAGSCSGRCSFGKCDACREYCKD